MELLKELLRYILYIAIAVIFILGIINVYEMIFVSSGDNKEVQKTVNKRKSVEVERVEFVRKFAEKYNALSNWDKNTIYYTVQLQELLVDSDRSVLCIGIINDIFKRDNQYYIRAKKTWLQKEIKPLEAFMKSQELMLNIHFILKIDREDANRIVRMSQKNRKNKKDDSFVDEIGDNAPIFAIIAKLHQISKPELHLAVSSSVEYWEGDASSDVSLDYMPSDTFIAFGECIALTHIGGSYRNLLFQ